MAAITYSSDGDYIYLALEDGSGNQLIARRARGSTTWASVYAPGGGSAANLLAVGGSVYFYGNFGTDVVLVAHDVATAVNSDISPASLGAKIVNGCAVNPGNPNEIVITVDTDQDALYSDDGGASWSTWSNALGYNATALLLLWGGLYEPHRLLVAGDNLTDLDIDYSPNELASSTNIEDGTIGAAANISALAVAEA